MQRLRGKNEYWHFILLNVIFSFALHVAMNDLRTIYTIAIPASLYLFKDCMTLFAVVGDI